MKRTAWTLGFAMVLLSPFLYAASDDASSNETSVSQEMNQNTLEIDQKVSSIKSEHDIEVPNRGDNDLFKTVVIDADKSPSPSSSKH